MRHPAGPSAPASARETSEGVVVGLRIRPLLAKDKAEGARECLRKIPNEPQVVLGADRPFTFNHVYDSQASQAALYEDCMRPIVESVISGYNATVLAYGQTGSGKTHTMGSAAAEAGAESVADLGEAAGLIPRSISELFALLTADETISVTATASFIEIYKEEVHDLLSWSEEDGKLATLPIRETQGEGLTLTGLQNRKVATVTEAMAVLAEGARNRATGATEMNATSSRSHAIFTLAMQLRRNGKTFTPKLHFVDLAGSERAKRTGASGERLQEGIQSACRALCTTPPLDTLVVINILLAAVAAYRFCPQPCCA